MQPYVDNEYHDTEIIYDCTPAVDANPSASEAAEVLDCVATVLRGIDQPRIDVYV